MCNTGSIKRKVRHQRLLSDIRGVGYHSSVPLKEQVADAQVKRCRQLIVNALSRRP